MHVIIWINLCGLQIYQTCTDQYSLSLIICNIQVLLLWYQHVKAIRPTLHFFSPILYLSNFINHDFN